MIGFDSGYGMPADLTVDCADLVLVTFDWPDKIPEPDYGDLTVRELPGRILSWSTVARMRGAAWLV